MSRHLRLVALGFAVSVATHAVPARAEFAAAPRVVIVQRSPQVSEDAAAGIAMQSTGGRVLSVRFADNPGGAAYLVKVLLPDGRVTMVIVDADTGSIR